MTSDYTARAGFNFDPREALAKLQHILKKGVDCLEENLSLMDKPIGKKRATKKVIQYSPEPFKSRANRNETMSYSIEFSRGRNDSPEYKKAFGELLEKLKAHQEEQRRIYSPKAPKKGITRS